MIERELASQLKRLARMIVSYSNKLVERQLGSNINIIWIAR